MSGKSYLPVLGDRGCPARHRLILPLRCPRGACPNLAGSVGVGGTRRGACPSLAGSVGVGATRRGACPSLAGSAGVGGARRGAEPQRHWLDLPRGRGPSQTPKFLSPGPPSPWLPALPIERRFYRFCTELAMPKTSPPPVPDWQVEQVPQAIQCRGAGGEAPGEINFGAPPSPPGRGVGGIGGRKAS